jgi:hypothetical protein
MNPSDYRRDFAAYHSALARERYRHHAGFSPRLDTEAIEERYADLRTREAVADLGRALEATTEHFETERRGLRALVAAAQLKHSEWRASEVAGELGLCAGAARVEWDGARVAAEGVPGLLAFEADAARRRELSRRWLDALGPCDDLRAARLEVLGGAAREFGFENRRELYKSFTGVDPSGLAAGAELFLLLTERAYMTGLSRWAARAFAPAPTRALEFADEFYFVRASHLDTHFPEGGFEAAYAETLNGLGLRAGSQQNLQLDAAARAGKGAWSECFAVEPPADVRLVLGARARGAGFLRQTFMEAGRAQMFAWASRETAARHPEFLRAPDAAAERGHAFLFAGLFRDAAWLGGHRGLRASAAAETAHSFALVELHDARRDCAALRHALALDDAPDVRADQLSEAYVAGHTEATGFRYDAAVRLLDAQDFLSAHTEARGDFFWAATRLRARLFAAAFGEHLRARHGRRWFSSRGAGDELVDVWNTASRHTVEELARLVWGGELSFELLAETLSAGADGSDV